MRGRWHTTEVLLCQTTAVKSLGPVHPAELNLLTSQQIAGTQVDLLPIARCVGFDAIDTANAAVGGEPRGES